MKNESYNEKPGLGMPPMGLDHATGKATGDMAAAAKVANLGGSPAADGGHAIEAVKPASVCYPGTCCGDMKK